MAMDRAAVNPRTIPGRVRPGGTGIRWPKWALAMLFLVDDTGFGTWAAHVPVFKQFLHLDNGSLPLVLGSVIVGSLMTMPATGQRMAPYGSRRVARLVATSYGLTIASLAPASSVTVLASFSC